MTSQADYFPALLRSLEGRDAAASMQALEEAATTHPADPRPLVILAAELMHARQVDRAEAAYMLALQRAPNLAIARFQLGLLQLTSGRVAAASVTWGGLDALPEDEPLRLFKTGLELIAADRLDEGRRLLLEGIARNKTNLPLNRDMQLVLDRVAGAQASAGDDPPADPPSAHFLVSTYGSTK